MTIEPDIAASNSLAADEYRANFDCEAVFGCVEAMNGKNRTRVFEMLCSTDDGSAGASRTHLG